MKRHKFITSFSIRENLLAITDPVLTRQIRTVLHLGIGEECIVGDGNGVDVLVRIVEFSDDGIVCAVIDRYENPNEPRVHVTLACAILKSDNFHFVVEKATEIGARTIIPLITARTIKKDVNVSRLQLVAREAAEQSDRGFVPQIETPLPIVRFIRTATSPAVVLHQTGAQEKVVGDVAQVMICVGPEGGWLDEEIAQMQQVGLLTRSLGKTVLRGETAAILGTYLACQGQL